jgi:hypothetical protein
MKKIIGIVFASLVFCNVGYSADIEGGINNIEILNEKIIGKTEIKILCIDTRKFILASSENGESLTPIMKEKGTGNLRRMVPQYCARV